MASKRPFFVIIPGGSQNPTHYGYLAHLLQLAGYPTYSALLPSVGAFAHVNATSEADMEYIRDRMILPVLDHEEHDVILVMHSYSGIPGSAAARGLGKAERLAQGKKTGVIGQIYFAAMLLKGGDETDILTATGGKFPPHLKPDYEAKVLLCDFEDRIKSLYEDVSPTLADAAAASTMAQGLVPFTSPAPRASWDSEDFKGRLAYIRAAKDNSLTLPLQQMLIDSTSPTEWIVQDIESAHSPQLSQPEKLSEIFIELAKKFEAL